MTPAVRVYLVGAGPGDPGLLTLRGRECIEQADVVVYDRLVSPQLLGYARSDCELIYVGKTPERHTLPQESINRLLVEKAQAGKTVVRLKGGDPFVFGRGGEEALELGVHGISYEVVPGVTSATAAPAYAGIPVTHRGLSSTFTVITGHEDPQKNKSSIDWHAISQTGGTLLFLMAMENLGLICAQLLRQGMAPSTPVAVIERGSWPGQRTACGQLRDIDELVREQGLGNPAVIVVGDVVTLREQLQWLERRPLFGRRIVVTRATHQASALTRRLLALGADVREIPVLAIGAPTRPERLRAAIDGLDAYHWLVFTSVNGVEAFFAALDEQGVDIRALADMRLAAIGPATANALLRRGLRDIMVPNEYRAEGLAAALTQQLAPGDRVLLPRAEDAREVLPALIEATGATVQDVPAYRTVVADGVKTALLTALRHGQVDGITFTSSSTVRNLLRLLDGQSDLLEGVGLYSIGPITSATLLEHGLHPSAEAAEYTMEGLVAAIVAG